MIHYEETGRGPAVLLLHGGGVDLRMWEPQVAALATDHRVIRADARGHGRSATPTEPFRQCDDVAELLRHLGVGRAVLVGLSMGAGAATDTALEHPDLVAGIVVCGAGTNEPTFGDPWILDLQRQMADAEQHLDAPRWIELFLQPLVIGPHRTAADVDPGVLARCREMVTDTVTHHVRPDATRPSHVDKPWERLGEITVPALGIYGDLDVSDHIAMTRRFAAGVRNGTTQAIAGTAHMPNMERPAEFNEALRAFLRTI